MIDLIELAEIVAEKYHDGQKDKQGQPYIGHLHRVAESLFPTTQYITAAAFLHDSLEDTDATSEALRKAGIPAAVVRTVEALTRREGESYADYIERIAIEPEAVRKIKIADLLDNSDPTRGPIPDHLRVRYHKALKRLVLG